MGYILTNTPIFQRIPLKINEIPTSLTLTAAQTAVAPTKRRKPRRRIALQRGSFMLWNGENLNFKQFSGIEKVHRNSIKITVDLWWRLRDSNPSKCKKPVASCGHQFKNWWQPYALPGAKRPSSPVVLPVHEKSGLFHIVGVCFLGFSIFKQKMYLILSLFC